MAPCWSENSTPPAYGCMLIRELNSARNKDQLIPMAPSWSNDSTHTGIFSGRSWHRYEIVLISGEVWKSERTLSGGVGIGVNLATSRPVTSTQEFVQISKLRPKKSRFRTQNRRTYTGVNSSRSVEVDTGVSLHRCENWCSLVTVAASHTVGLKLLIDVID